MSFAWQSTPGLMFETVHLQASFFSSVLKRPTRWLSAWINKMGTSRPLLNCALFASLCHTLSF